MKATELMGWLATLPADARLYIDGIEYGCVSIKVLGKPDEEFGIGGECDAEDDASAERTTNEGRTRALTLAETLEALRAVLPYAESRAEDMTECAEHLDEQVKPGVTIGFDVAQAEARDLADKAWQSVQHAQSILADAAGGK